AHWGRLARWVHRGTRSLQAALWTPLLGTLSAVPLLARVLFPRATAALSRWTRRKLVPTPVTRLSLLRSGEDPEHEHPPEALGFTADEAVARVAGTLENLGLTSTLAPLVVLLGHGARSQNNPHASAYECGACGGRHGGPSARAFALGAND